MRSSPRLSFVAVSGAVAWAEEAAAPPPGEGSQIPPTDWGLQIWTLVTFVVLLVLLAKFAFKPIAQALDRRGETIKKSIEDAEKQRADAKKLMDDYQKQLAEARNEAGKIIEEARQLGERVRKEVVDKANAEASAAVQRAQEEIQRQEGKGHSGDEGHRGRALRPDRLARHRKGSQRSHPSPAR